MFPITFNAFGDIVTAAEILYGLAKALSETRGAPVDYRRYITDLRTMAGTMGQIHSIFLTSDALDDSVRDLVLAKVEECYTCAQTAFDRVARVRDLGVASRSDAGIVRRIRRGLCKIEWHVWSRGDAAKVQEEMKTAQQYLQTAMAVVNYCETVELGAQVSAIQQDGQTTHRMLDAILSDTSRARERDAALSANVARTHAGVQVVDLRVMEVLARVSGLQVELRAMRADPSTDMRADVQSIRSSMHILDTNLMEVLDRASAAHEGVRTSRREPVQSRRHTPSARADAQTLEQSTAEVLQTLRDIQGTISATQRTAGARVGGECDLPLQKGCPWCSETALQIGATQMYICTSTLCGRQCHITESKSSNGHPSTGVSATAHPPVETRAVSTEPHSEGPLTGPPARRVPTQMRRPVQKRAVSTKPPSKGSSTFAAARPQQVVTSAPALHEEHVGDFDRESYIPSISTKVHGDIVTAAQILYGIAKALSETYGAPAEYRCYVEDLHDMAAMMMQLHSIISSSGFPNAKLAQILLPRIEECYLRVREGLSRVAKFESLGIELEPGTASPGQVIRRGYAKVEWHIRRRGDVVKFREDMQIALQRLQIMINIHELLRVRSYSLDNGVSPTLRLGGSFTLDII